MKITITGQTPSKKNSKRILVNKATGKPFVASSKIATEWETAALWQLKKWYGLRFKYPIIITMVFYTKDKRKHDLDNMASSCLDALTKGTVIEDDNCTLVSKIVLEYGGIDPDNARVEIEINELVK